MFCNFTGNKEISKKYFLISLYYSLKKNDNLSLLLLKICKEHCLLRPHYFWPLLIRQANKYNVQGIYFIFKYMKYFIIIYYTFTYNMNKNIFFFNKNIFLGILNILYIMNNDFNISPCIDTITDYVLPFIYGEVIYIRKLLMKHKISETIINNSYVLFLLKKRKIAEATRYSE